MSVILKHSKSTGVTLEKAGEIYEVRAEGDLLTSTSVLSLAEVEYAEAVDARSETAKRNRAKEKYHFEMQAMRSESFARRTAGSRKSGGKGGRGGV